MGRTGCCDWLLAAIRAILCDGLPNVVYIFRYFESLFIKAEQNVIVIMQVRRDAVW